VPAESSQQWHASGGKPSPKTGLKILPAEGKDVLKRAMSVPMQGTQENTSVPAASTAAVFLHGNPQEGAPQACP